MPQHRHLIAVILVALAFSAIDSYAQAPGPTTTRPRFEAVSIKPSDGRNGIDLRYFAGRFVASAVTVQQLICEAYGIDPRELTGGPDWIRVDRFDVIGSSADDASPDRMRPMLQAALIERFKVDVGRESRVGTVYTLTAPNTKNLTKPADPGERSMISLNRSNIRTSGTLSFELEGHNATMAAFAQRLSNQLGALVNDSTGISGNYDFKVRYTLDSAFGGLEPDPDIPTIFTALQNELGLKLVAGRGPVDVYVVRNVAKPTPN